MQFHQDRTYDRRIRAFESAKNDCATGVHGHCIADWFRQVRTSLDRSEQVWSAIFPQLWVAHCPNLTQPPTCMQFSNRTSLKTLWPSEVVESALCHASTCRKVWTGMKCNFSWDHFQKPYIIGKLSISRVRMCNFIRIGPKTKKLWLLRVQKFTFSI